jgi:hypothetical protein
VRGIATSSSIFSTHGSTPPKSERRTVGGAYSFDVLLPVPVRLRLLPSSPRVDRSLRLLCELVEGTGTGGVPSAAPEAGDGTGSGRGGSSEGVDVDGGGGGGVAALVDGTVCVVEFRLTFLFCQRPCIDLLSALGPWLTRCEDCSLWDD